MRKISALLLSFICFISPSWSQTALKLTLGHSIEMGLTSSKRYKISLTDIDAARARLAQAKDQVIPNVGVSGAYYRVGKPIVVAGSGLQGLLKSASSNNGGSGNTGGGSGAASINVKDVWLAQASLNEPIFQGFRTKYAIKSEKLLEKAAELTAANDKEEVVLNTLEAFYNIYKLQSEKRILTEDLNEQKRRVKDFSNLEANGLLTRNDLLKAEVQQSNIELSLLDAENNLQVAYFNFKTMLGIPESTPLDLDTVKIFNAHPVRAQEEYIQQAVANRNDLRASLAQVASYQFAVKGARSAYYPSLNLSAGYLDAYLPGFLNLKRVLDASLGVRYSLTGLITTKHKVDEAKAGVTKSLLSYNLQLDNIRMAIDQNYLGYTESLQRIQVSEKIIQQSDENYKILKNKYNNSLATLTDLLDADLSLLQAKINAASASADAEVAYYRLLNASGETYKPENFQQ